MKLKELIINMRSLEKTIQANFWSRGYILNCKQKLAFYHSEIKARLSNK